MKLIDSEINKFLTNKLRPPENHPTALNAINFYFENVMTSHFKNDEKNLRKIFTNHVQTLCPNDKANLVIYYKNRKVKNLFIRNRPQVEREISQDHHLVYQYTCTLGTCNGLNQYVGYTETTLYQRFGGHTQLGAIKEHMSGTHNITELQRRELLSRTKVLIHGDNKRDLLFLEALLIKETKLTLNKQTEFSRRLLHIFKH